MVSYSRSLCRLITVKNLFKETYIRDIIDRNKIRKSAELDDLVNILASGVGSLTNPHKLSSSFKSIYHSDVSEQTIANYISYLEDAFILCRANRYNVKGRKYIGTPNKFYFEDVGLRNARLNFRQMEENHIMENVVFNELRYRGFNVDVGVVEKRSVTERTYYEIDFVANKGSQRYYIQSAFEMSDAEKREQETKSLESVSDGFKKIIVVKDVVKPYYDEKGILTIGLFDFLMDSSWM